MSCIEEMTGKIDRSQIRPLNEVIKGYTPLQDGDLLFAKITPCMENGKIVVADNLENGLGFASTEFHVIRFGRNMIPNFYRYYLLQEKIRKQAEKNMTGSAGQKRVPTSFIQNLVVPVPPLDTQRKIVAILEKVEATQRLRAEADFQGHKLIYNAFNGFFGDFDENPYGWEIVELRDIVREKITDGVHKTPKYCEDGVPFISANNIKNNQIDFTRCKKISTEEHELLARRCNPENGDILLSKVGTLGMVAKVDNDNLSIFVQLALIKPNKKLINSNFLKYALLTNSLQKQIQSYANMSTMKYIGVGKIGLLKIVLPPISIQESFSSIVEWVEKIQEGQQKSKNEVNTLFSGLMIRAFTGELVA
ncbi:type I restriction enzyme, S subunit [Methanoculleus thermophilus]|uniref:Type I restriction enzyme, S subunit n=2 Tax=Methanoculleus thermophilus TaxID=2200 RepID=A0A1G9B0N9_9EURY|nr:type I restriction enzyme, S subunit [Methanoculleus thermophilus]